LILFDQNGKQWVYTFDNSLLVQSLSFLLWRSETMKNGLIHLFFKAMICIILPALSACAPQPAAVTTEPTQPPAASPTPTVTETAQPAGQAFTSERFSYSFEYPTGWIIKDKPGEWPDFDPLDPNRTAGIDAFAGYVNSRNLALGIGARELPEGETLEAWGETAKSLIKDGVSKGVCYEGIEDDPVSEEEITLGSEPAILLQYECPEAHDSFGLVALSVHHQKGYWITWIAPQGNADADKTEFTQILSTFCFTD
jgi:hypothetical protein